MAKQKIRYGVVGLGHISQIAVLPAFKHADENSELTALISSDPEKLKTLSETYRINSKNCYSYEQYDEAMANDAFDAVYIALPNDMHKDFTVKAANAGKHILCEKPMAPTTSDCREMMNAAESNNVKLMIAYRLHFEKTNMLAVEMIKAGKIGEPRLFNSTFSLQVREGNIRTKEDRAGGPLNDIGIYCINACRYLFQDEPSEVVSMFAQGTDERFNEIEESCSAIMRFPNERLGSFSCSFGAKDVSRFEIVGTEGRILLEPAYDYAVELEYVVESGKHTERHKTPKRDQFAPELVYFSNCILNDTPPEPSGLEGIADMQIMEAIKESARSGQVVKLGKRDLDQMNPSGKQIQQKPAIKKPPMINVESGSRD